MTESGKSRKAAKRRTPRGITSAGLLLLCVCFFLPQVKSCDQPVTPAVETYDEGAGWLIIWGLPFVFAFAVGSLYGPWHLLRKERTKAAIMRLTCACCILILGWGCIQMTRVVMDEPDATALVILGLLGVAVLAACISAAKASSKAKGPMCVFFFGLASIGYFLYWPLMTSVRIYYGLWFSVTASTLIAAGALWEALGVKSK